MQGGVFRDKEVLNSEGDAQSNEDHAEILARLLLRHVFPVEHDKHQTARFLCL